jgi:hypothetical protein
VATPRAAGPGRGAGRSAAVPRALDPGPPRTGDLPAPGRLASCPATTGDRAEDRPSLDRQAHDRRALDRPAGAIQATGRRVRDRLTRVPAGRGSPVTLLVRVRRTAADPAPKGADPAPKGVGPGSVSMRRPETSCAGGHIRRSLAHRARGPATANRTTPLDRAMGRAPAVGRAHATSGFLGGRVPFHRPDPATRAGVDSTRRARVSGHHPPRTLPGDRRRDEDTRAMPAAIDPASHGPVVGPGHRARGRALRRLRRRGRGMPVHRPSSRSDRTRSWSPAAARSRRRSPPGVRPRG